MTNKQNRLLSLILEHFMISLDVYEDEENEETFTHEKLTEYTNLTLCQYLRSGSSAEKLYLPFSNHVKSDIDLMFEFPYIYVVDPEQFTSNERQKYKANNQIRFLYLDYSNKKYPCYVTLYYYSMQELIVTNEKTDSSHLLPGTNKYIIPGDFIDPYRKYFLSSRLVNWMKNQWPIDEDNDEELEIHGPSICITSKNSNFPLPMDHVTSLKCIHWPTSARHWINRVRISNWPEQNLINSIIKFGCHLVPIPHLLSTSKIQSIEWRLSFSICELLLAKTLSYYQRKCYLIVKALFDVHIKQDLELSKLICSYYLKTILFWLCESIEKEQWTYETLYDRFIEFINYIIVCFEKKRLKHYFIPEMNLIHHFNDEQLKKLIEKCILMKNNLLTMIEQCEEYYWNTNQFKRFNPIIEVLVKNENFNENSCIIWFYGHTMHAFIKQHQLTDRPLKMVKDCIKRNYLELCSNESAKYLLYVTSLIANILHDKNIYSVENLSVHNAMMKICDAKLFYDQNFEDIKTNYIEIQNHLNNENK
ncbi:unnamed protein product [Rotaria sp. Silwood2]|nr:unnamed protein product [Rotaria sp. Silwood2]